MVAGVGQELVMGNMGLGEEIRKVRVDRRMTQTQLADQLGISQGHVSNIERGVTSDLATVKRAFGVLGIDPKAVMMRDSGADPVEIAILSDPTLRTDDRRLLVDIYKVFRSRGPLGGGDAM